MAIGSIDYPTPVTVNGFSCRNCSEVDLAAKRIDPAHPRSGPDDRDAAADPTRQGSDPIKVAAARRLADHARQSAAGYSPAGIVFQPVPTGSAFTLRA